MKLNRIILGLFAFITLISCNEDDGSTGFPNQRPVIYEQTFNPPGLISDTDIIGLVKAFDANVGTKLAYSITQNSSDLFEIANVTGALKLKDGKNLDFNSEPSHKITVTVSDFELEASAQITINVNVAPQFEDETYEFEVDEDIAVDYVIGALTANDVHGDELEFSISKNDNELFEINETGELSLVDGKELNFTEQQEHSITVAVSDDIHTVEKEVVIKVVDVELGGPTVENTYFEVEEDILDTDLIGNLGAEDPDGDQIEYLIVQNDSDLFRITENGEIFLEEGMSLNYEESTAHEIQISVSDGKEVNLAMVQIVVLNVEDELFELPSSFITKWEVKGDGGTISIATNENYSYDYTIDWGDGTVEKRTDQDPSHTYDAPGVYTVAIAGDFPAIRMGKDGFDESLKKTLISIEQWGDIVWESMSKAFYGCLNLEYKATDLPNLTNVTNLSYMFADCPLIDGDLNDWNTENVTGMSYMFYNAIAFDGNIEDWNVRNVTHFGDMFNNATSFNQNISGWNTQSGVYFGRMFGLASSFDQDLGNWNMNTSQNMVDMISHSGMSPENYSNTLIGWANQNLPPNDILFVATNVQHCQQQNVGTAITTLENLGWTILDAGSVICP
ncbi:BspA family leucine-rich repeat surface protein [Flagellimonas zhangzhouensis]|uniref:Surface protein n=1 Tax=Flagellimonas zhangzhouensis TaxID=1073328 RepID=A0A1H2S039_9FLAO|nr:BspA family leucine-rich repeat surface protein [Allomuricauda zhangzhouensis]SDQ69175.1 surface protein [Allomuricauda zhangzhouensis]SDW24915.1 surface protein [Allomuricauda zhangzhouensis]